MADTTLVIGIDEAGYGPNLGPFVMSAAAVEVSRPGDLWCSLAEVVRRAGGRDDGRFVVDDSKKVNTGKHGLARLERGLFVPFVESLQGVTVGSVAQAVAPASLPDLAAEAWWKPDEPLPLQPAEGLAESRSRFLAACAAAGVRPAGVWSVAVPAPRFNLLVEAAGTKGIVLGCGLTRLLADAVPTDAGGPVEVFVDHHGGRNRYAPLIQTAFPTGWVVVEEERADRSAYRVEQLPRPVRLTFTPQADGSQFTVALASMVSKYLREAFMAQFNRHWQAVVPGLKATAGYPQDAARWIAEVRPTLHRLGVAESAVWRCR